MYLIYMYCKVHRGYLVANLQRSKILSVSACGLPFVQYETHASGRNQVLWLKPGNSVLFVGIFCV